MTSSSEVNEDENRELITVVLPLDPSSWRAYPGFTPEESPGFEVFSPNFSKSPSYVWVQLGPILPTGLGAPRSDPHTLVITRNVFLGIF